MSKSFINTLNNTLNKEENQPYSYEYFRVPIKKEDRTRFIYVLYCMHLESHKIVNYSLFTRKPTVKDVLHEFNRNDLKNYALVFVKGSPFIDKTLTDYLDRMNISYIHYSKKDPVAIITIFNLYLKRMLELHLDFNNQIFNENHADECVVFWNEIVTLVTHNLPTQNLIENSYYLESKKLDLFKVKKYDGSNDKEMFLMDPYILVEAKIYIHQRHPLTFLIIYNYATGKLESYYPFKGYTQEKNVIFAINQIQTILNRNTILYLPKGEPFNTESVQRFLEKKNIKMEQISKDIKSDQRMSLILALSRIIQNFIKDSNRHLVPNIKENPQVMSSLFKHWNLHICYIIHYQAIIASYVYKKED
jgi:hypothetical protein